MPKRIPLHREQSLPTCINWKWIETTGEGRYAAHYCQDGQCRDLGTYETANDANRAVLIAIRNHIHQAVRNISTPEH